MEPELDPLETFKNDVMQRLSMLSELISTIDDSTTTTVRNSGAWFSMFYNLTTPSSECVAKLLVKLLDLTPPSIQGSTTKRSGEVVVTTGLDLTGHFVQRECQYDFEATITQVIWNARPIIVTDTLFQAGHMTTRIMGKQTLGSMADSDHLFIPENFELFINTCFSCGPQLDALSGKIDHVAVVINKAFARVPAEPNMFKFAIAGLVAARDNNWIVETNTTPRVLTPETEPTTPRVLNPETKSTVELEVVTQGDLLPPG